jgi:hypothetical protein
MRKSLVAAIEEAIDFTSPAQVQRYLRVTERLLETL